MDRPLPFRAIVAVLIGVSLSGCVVRTAEKPIVLRRPSPERRLAVRKPVVPVPAVAAAAPVDPAPSVPAASGGDATATLTPEQKERLFQDFDRYLARPAP